MEFAFVYSREASDIDLDFKESQNLGIHEKTRINNNWHEKKEG